jgi:putative ABC transport system ATP-binding protein
VSADVAKAGQGFPPPCSREAGALAGSLSLATDCDIAPGGTIFDLLAAKRALTEKQGMAAPQQSLIKLEDISKVYVTDEVETHALAGVHLEIKAGEYVAIGGPSGCGKTTLLSILGLLDVPSSGTYTLNGQPVSGLNAAQRAQIRNREIGFIFQAFNLISELTVYENVELPLTYRGMPGDERKQRVHEALERVGMSNRVRHYPGQLSGGQQQRVAVARAIVGRPLILLADEPTGNLDSVNGETVMSLLQELHSEGATICMVTHDPRYARHAERTIHLFDGQVVEEQTGPRQEELEEKLEEIGFKL